MTLPDRALPGASCSACDAALPAGARSCPACGAPLAMGRAERRVVTVLFADLVDSTRLVESLDPEATRRPDGVAEPDAFVHLAEAYLAEGDLEAAAAAIRRARASLQPGDVVLHAEVERVEAHLVPALVDAGLHDEAAEVAEEVRRHAEAIGAYALAQGLPEAAP